MRVRFKGKGVGTAEGVYGEKLCKYEGYSGNATSIDG